MKMNYNTYTLANGLRIIHLPSAQPVVYCGYAVGAGTRDEELGREEGMAHFCEHITFKGTERRSSMQILGHLESVGGDLNAFTNKEETVYHAAVLKENIDRAVDLLTDIVFHSTYPQAEIDKEVEVIVDEIESYNDSPAELVYDLFENAVFGGHPLGHNILGTAEKLRRYTTADALRFTRRYYRPENSVFFAYGDVDFRKLVRLLERANAADAASESVAAVSLLPQQQALCDESAGCGGGKDIATAVLPPYVAQHIEHHMDTHLAHVMLGTRAYDVHDERRIALYLLNNILGGPGMNAKLNLALREHNGLVYTVESTMVAYGDTGTWSIYFGCDEHDIKRCLRLVRKELDRMMEKPLSDAQLKAAKKQIKGQIGVACDNRENFALDFGKSFLHYGWEKNVDCLYEQVEAITSQQIQDVARELFDKDRLITLIFK